MTKKILVTAVLVGTLATGAFAFNKDCQNSGQKGMKNQQNMQQKNMQKQTQKKGWHGYKMRQKGIKHSDNMMGQRGGMQMFSQLNLSDDQRFELSILRDEMKLEMKKLRGAKRQGKMLKFIDGNSFDKKAFTKEANEMHTKRITIKANHMEKVFKLLTKEQITELKKNLK